MSQGKKCIDIPGEVVGVRVRGGVSLVPVDPDVAPGGGAAGAGVGDDGFDIFFSVEETFLLSFMVNSYDTISYLVMVHRNRLMICYLKNYPNGR